MNKRLLKMEYERKNDCGSSLVTGIYQSFTLFAVVYGTNLLTEDISLWFQFFLVLTSTDF